MRIIQHLVGALSAAFILLSSPMFALAATISPDPYPINVQVTTAKHDGMPMTAFPLTNWPAIVSKAAVVMDMNTGTVVYAKNPLASHYPASITKILTAELALKLGHLHDMLSTSKLATEQDGNRVYLIPGEVEPLRKLLFGLLLNSGNDAAVVIAQKYGGSVSGFAKLMNQQAQALGADHSHFTNPNGLPDPNHVTTAYDMALISRSAMSIPEFRKIVATKYYDWHGEQWNSELVNLNHMLFNYNGTIGIKTGYTSIAHETLVVAAKRGTTTFLAVLMDAPLDSEIRQDATSLLNFAFAHYQTQILVKQDETVGNWNGADGTIPIQAAQAVMATVPVNHDLSPQLHVIQGNPDTPLPAGAVVGRLAFDIQDHLIAQTPLIIARPIAAVDVASHAVRSSTSLTLVAILVVVLLTTFLLRLKRRFIKPLHRPARAFATNVQHAAKMDE
jgi:D-alanyl-D-alanine carboxypeptidase (penicillin-binding protein 5/6)